MQRTMESSASCEDGSYKCVYCGKTNCSIHAGLKPCCCDECCEEFANTGLLKTHFPGRKGKKLTADVVVGESPLGCCQPPRRKIRKSIINSVNVKPYKCEECEAAFTRNWDLRRHTRIHTRNSQSLDIKKPLKPFPCNECGVAFSQNGHLKEHLLNHSISNPYGCAACGATFSRNSLLLRHACTHQLDSTALAPKPKPHKCDECGAGFGSRGHLKAHILIHTGEKPHRCDECGTSFARNCDLQRHIRTHAGGCGEKQKPRLHCCADCGAEFTTRSHLRNHTIIHTGERSFRCDECGITYARNYDLQRHKQSHVMASYCVDAVPSEKCFPCEECGATFASRSYLKNHMYVHTGEKPHQCTECFASFSRNADLHRHVQTHKDVKPPTKVKVGGDNGKAVFAQAAPSVRELLGIPKVVLYIQ